MKNQLLVYSQSNSPMTNRVVTYQLTNKVMTFGDILRKELNERDMTAAELSRRSGVTKQHLHKILNNEQSPMTGAVTKPSVDTVDKIAKGLGWNVNEARLAAGYAPTNAIRKPQTIPELVAALESMGIEPPQLYGGYTKDPDGEGFKEIVERIWLDIQLVINRLAKGQSAGYEVQEITLSEIDHIEDVPIPQLKRSS